MAASKTWCFDKPDGRCHYRALALRTRMAASASSACKIACALHLFAWFEFLLPLDTKGKWPSMFGTGDSINAE